MERVWKEVFGDFIPVDNVPTGAYPYAPVFRRIGTLSIGRQVFYSPRRVYSDVNVQYYRLRGEGKDVRKVVFLSRGEPTLDLNLGREAEALRAAGFSPEILTCGAILWREDVREDLSRFGGVVLELVAVSEEVWRRVAHGYEGRLDALIRVVQGVPYDSEGPALRDFLTDLGIGRVFVLSEGGDVSLLLPHLRGEEIKVILVDFQRHQPPSEARHREGQRGQHAVGQHREGHKTGDGTD